jgi:hypothetical protein
MKMLYRYIKKKKSVTFVVDFNSLFKIQINKFLLFLF